MLNLLQSEKSRDGDLAARIEALRDELAELGREAKKQGIGVYRGAAHSGRGFFSELPEYLHSMTPAARRQTRAAKHVVRDHPTAAIGVAGLVLVGLAATLIYARR
ncbi:MAG: hypothetical protein JJ913_19600 [Rhizobiaceae bacterium]|nr:hypothetical protein [Rhizobiaceae bacterium]